MRNFIILYTIILILSSCNNASSNKLDKNHFNLPKDILINSKTFATKFNVKKFSDIAYCEIDSSEINSLKSCLIQKSDSIKYIRKATFIFDSTKRVQQLFEYHSEGALTYEKEDLLKDTTIVGGGK